MTRLSIIATCALFLLLAAASGARAQNNVVLTVTGVRNISFGKIYRGSTMTIPYTSANSAEFNVSGRQGRKVRITVTTINLALGLDLLPITVTNSECGYSVDNGVTWTAFSTGTLFQEVELGNIIANGAVGTVLVRVGGTVTSTASQTRGTYTGSISVSAIYL